MVLAIVLIAGVTPRGLAKPPHFESAIVAKIADAEATRAGYQLSEYTRGMPTYYYELEGWIVIYEHRRDKDDTLPVAANFSIHVNDNTSQAVIKPGR